MACFIAEAEYVATGRCCAQILWIQIQLLDYGFNFSNTPICFDTTHPIQMIQNLMHQSKTKHVDIWHHLIKYTVQKGKVELFYIPSIDQLVDTFTNVLDQKTLTNLIADLGMLSMT